MTTARPVEAAGRLTRSPVHYSAAAADAAAAAADAAAAAVVVS